MVSTLNQQFAFTPPTYPFIEDEQDEDPADDNAGRRSSGVVVEGVWVSFSESSEAEEEQATCTYHMHRQAYTCLCRPPASIKIPIADNFDFVEHMFASSLDFTEDSEGEDPLSDADEMDKGHDGSLSEPELVVVAPLGFPLCRRRARSVDAQRPTFVSTAERCRPAFASVHSLLASTGIDGSSSDEDGMGNDEDE